MQKSRCREASSSGEHEARPEHAFGLPFRTVRAGDWEDLGPWRGGKVILPRGIGYASRKERGEGTRELGRARKQQLSKLGKE